MNEKSKIKLVLGSASPFRRKLLEEAGFVFDVVTADINEKQIRSNDFSELVLRIAQAKMDAILANNTFEADTIIVTSDFVVSNNGQLREKPESKEEVISWHKDYSKQKSICYCSVVVHHVGINKTLKTVDTATIYWGDIPDRVIEQIAADPITYKSAGFSNRSFLHYMEKLEGSIDTVIGLPLRILEKYLEELGYYK